MPSKDRVVKRVITSEEDILRGRTGGTTSKYDPSFVNVAYHLRLLGANLEGLAQAFDVDRTTVSGWAERYPEFNRALREGGDLADAKVAHALYRRALGYTKKLLKASGSVEEVHYPPDVNACCRWLSGRRRGKDYGEIWRLKDPETAEAPEAPQYDDAEIARRIAFLLAKHVTGEVVDVPEQQQLAQE